jgi:hypothetical protein
MAHFAKIENDYVVDVIVAEQEYIDELDGEWIQTSYNTYGGVHYDQQGNPDGGIPLRMNYGGIGSYYHREKDLFIPPRIHAGWILNEATYRWEPPVPYPPDDGNIYVWDNDLMEFKNLGLPATNDGSVIPQQ